MIYLYNKEKYSQLINTHSLFLRVSQIEKNDEMRFVREKERCVICVVWFWNGLICVIVKFWVGLINDQGVQK